MTHNDFETYRLAKRRTWRLAQAIQMGDNSSRFWRTSKIGNILQLRDLINN